MVQNRKYSWSIVIPAFNEESIVEDVVEKSIAFLRSKVSDYEVVVVNDGSTDKTGEILENMKKENPELRVIHHEKNMGIGCAWRTLYRTAKKDFIFTCPADGQFDPFDFSYAEKLLKNSDAISIFRIGRKDPFIRKVISYINKFLNKLLCDLSLKDVNWVKVYKRKVLQEVDYCSTTPFIETEIFAKIKNSGGVIAEVGAPHHPRTTGEAKGGSLTYIWKTTIDLFTLSKELKK